MMTPSWVVLAALPPTPTWHFEVPVLIEALVMVAFQPEAPPASFDAALPVESVKLLAACTFAKVRLDRGQLGLVLGGRELRNRDGRQDADDHNHDQQLDEGKALTVEHLSSSPKG